MGKSNRFLKTSNNLFWQLVYQILALILGLVLPNVVIRVYGSEVNGLTSTAKYIVTLVTLAKAGISTAATFSLYKSIQDNDREKIAAVLNQSRKLFWVIGIVVAVFGALASGILAFIQESKIGSIYVFTACLVMCLQTAVDLAFTAVENIFFNASQDKYLISVGLLMFTIVSYGLEFLVCFLNAPFILLYFCGLVACIIKIVYLEIVFKRKFKDYRLKENETMSAEKLNFSGIGFATMNEVAHAIVFASQSIIISLIYGFLQVSVFSIYAMVVNALCLIAQVFYASFSPSYGSVVAEGDSGKINQVFRIFQFCYMALVTIMFMCAGFLFIPFVKIYTSGVNDINYVNVVLMISFIIYGVFYSLRVPYNLTCNVYGIFKEPGIQTLITSIISIGISVAVAIFDYAYILVGPIVFYMTNTFYQHFMIKKYVATFDNNHFWRHIIVLATGVVLSTSLGFVIPSDWFSDSYLRWIIVAAITSICSFVFFVLVSWVIDRKCFIETVHYFKRKFLKK